MTLSEIQYKIDKLYARLTWVKGANKDEQRDKIIAEINQLQAVYDAMVYAGVRDGEWEI